MVAAAAWRPICGLNMPSWPRSGARGAWDVFSFRVRTEAGPIFDLYYDRAPKGTANRKGEWLLFRELTPVEDV